MTYTIKNYILKGFDFSGLVFKKCWGKCTRLAVMRSEIFHSCKPVKSFSRLWPKLQSKFLCDFY